MRDFEQVAPLLEPPKGQDGESRRTIRALAGSGVLALLLIPLALYSDAVGLAGFLGVMAVVILTTALLLQRGVARDPWQRTGAGDADPAGTPTLDRLTAEPHVHLPIGPGRAGAEAADELLHGHDDDAS